MTDFTIGCGNFTPSTDIKFYINSNDDAPLVLTEDGFLYLGKLVPDAGEAHKLFTDFMNRALFPKVEPK